MKNRILIIMLLCFIFNFAFVFMFGKNSIKIFIKDFHEKLVLNAKKTDKNFIMAFNTGLQDKLIKNFFGILNFLKKSRKKNIFLKIGKSGKIINRINFKKNSIMFWDNLKNEKMKFTYLKDIKNLNDFNKEFISYALKSNYENKDKKLFYNSYKIDILSNKVFFYKTLNNEWYFKFNGKESKLSVCKTDLRKFLVFKDSQNRKFYAIPKSGEGNIYFSETTNEEWKFFGIIN